MRYPDFTLTAGPTASSPRVLAALGSPMLYDYDPVFLDRFRGLERKVAQLFQTSSDIVLMQGEAVLGLEAAARAVTRPGMTAINCVSGVYGKWFGLWLAEYGATVVEVEVPYDAQVEPEMVERAFAAHPEAEVLAVVHSETPSGTINPVAEIGSIAQRHGALVIADVVSSLGCDTLRPDDWGLDICVAGPQKCLAGPPGMSLVSVSDEAWKRIRANPAAPRGSFLSLLDWKDTWIDGGRTSFPYTPSVSDVNGIDAACDEALEMGIEAYVAMHERAARATRAGVLALGTGLWARSEDICTNCVTAARTPDGVDTMALLAHIREHYGVMLSPGYGELKEKLVRLGHMGPAARSLNPVVAVAAFGQGLADLGARRRHRRGRRGGARRAVGREGPRVTLPAFDLHRPRHARGGDRHPRAPRRRRDPGRRRNRAAAPAQARLRHVRPPRGRARHPGAVAASGSWTASSRSAPPRPTARSSAPSCVREQIPALAEMERSVANIRVRTAGTLGGNLCFGDPHSDPATFLLAAGAEAVVRRGGAAPRVLAMADLQRGPYETALEEGDLLVAIRVPAATAGTGIAHRKLAFRERPAATVAVWVRADAGRIAEARIAVGSVGGVAVRAGAAEALLADGATGEEVADAAARQAVVEDDANGSAEYKRQLVRVLVGRTLADAELGARA